MCQPIDLHAASVAKVYLSVSDIMDLYSKAISQYQRLSFVGRNQRSHPTAKEWQLRRFRGPDRSVQPLDERTHRHSRCQYAVSYCAANRRYEVKVKVR